MNTKNLVENYPLTVSKTHTETQNLFPRGSGVLLHVSSLPGEFGSGDLGADAIRFIDWLAKAGMSYWQILPLNGISVGNSPYMSTSAFAGNVLFVSLDKLHEKGLLKSDDLLTEHGFNERQVDFENVIKFRMDRLKKAGQQFSKRKSKNEQKEFNLFCNQQSFWLDDYALFMALSDTYPECSWNDWPSELACRDTQAIEKALKTYKDSVLFWKFCQWVFFEQWNELKNYSNQKGIKIIGDLPIFVAYHSADVWSHPELFKLDERYEPTVVAGVPPDYFSETGQRWGNPLYSWSSHKKTNYQWWVERVRVTMEMVDIVRLDHFRGLAAYWEIPAENETAIEGQWQLGPGSDLLSTLKKELGSLPIIAEDLGEITPDVGELRIAFDLPGMVVLQFAWGPGGDKRFLPHNHRTDCVVYSGTHDNDTTISWWNSISEEQRHHLREYLSTNAQLPHWDLILSALASVANISVIPIQDLLGMGNEHRMNIPGRLEGNWCWRLLWSDLPDDLSTYLSHINGMYGRG